MHAKYDISISYGSKVLVTDRRTNKQDKNKMPPIIQSRGMKMEDLLKKKEKF